ncbi:leucine-rich repeat-containing protein 19 [Hyperolius riggenbachi]|uniref:leucine-rich repeat-containing protein 19 n=1 Tax=Hyperolius riggenbachi TaxID=752182 RepID=UPI0035A3A21C
MKMLILLLMIWMGSSLANFTCNDNKECSCIGCGLIGIPVDLTTDVLKLNLSNSDIGLDQLKALKRFSNLTELDLSHSNISSLDNGIFPKLFKLEVLLVKNNSITFVEAKSFDGLESLRFLDLSFNQITQLPSTIQLPKQLQSLNLQNNHLMNLELKEALKDLITPLNITLSENPWNCTCSLMNLLEELNTSKLILNNEDITTCATPKGMENSTIKSVWDKLKCPGSTEDPSTTKAVSYTGNPTTASLYTTIDGTDNTTINGTSDASMTGNSWRFLVGVLIVGLVTSFLIFAAIKFPKWYNFLISYNHHRLKEEEPYMFEEEFNVDFTMDRNDKIQEEDEMVVVFEQTHSFVPEDDGFIEDKYIDEKDMRAES